MKRTHQPLLSTLSSVVETVVKLRSMGHKVVLVSSGAIGVGLQRMNMPSRPKGLSGKQALAAIGQGRLIALWDNLFGQFEQPIAQVLLTRGDISDRTRYLNAVNTFKELLSLGVVPIVNENDTVSVSEIKFGDNDTLSAITASMISADYLFLLTDVDGLYTANPRKDPDARLVETVDNVSAIRNQVSTATAGSSLGTGGMETKLIAAEIATAAGVTTSICSSRHPENTAHGQRRSAPRHTCFTAAANPVRDLKSWVSHTLHPAGSVVIDAGAYRVLSKRTSGGRLLPAGVLGAFGDFSSGQAVRICVKIEKASEEEEEFQRNAYNQHRQVAKSSLPLSEPASGADTPRETEEEEEHPPFELTEDDVVEVGRGLANYNFSQINRLKGLNSSHMPRVLGYADSEYVVESITIALPADSAFSPSLSRQVSRSP
ncbi:glutamate 5-kinase [Coprinellus micaceus]|uniref:Glutamate 5-kinase n=1 Tax=Coprinellus micaceus TaxID=71717 RepID=A0A4Y7TB88_COPMI|nr:glutamate 5-kinase [Coprinellus micaceus]